MERESLPSSGLWDEIHFYVRDLMHESEVELPVFSQSVSPKARVPNNRSVIQEAAQTDGSVDAEHSRVFLPEVAAAVQEDIESIKERYIVGKIVGRDLLDASGRRIAQQGERITRKMVREAETVGILVDLIEDMTFDSFEE